MIDSARNGVCGDDAIWDERGPRGPHPPSAQLKVGHGAAAPGQAPIPSGWSDFPACLKNKAGRPSLPALSSAMFIGHDEFQLCRGQLRPAELLGADAQTLLPQQRRAPHPPGAFPCEESGLVRTQSGQLCFARGLRENQE